MSAMHRILLGLVIVLLGSSAAWTPRAAGAANTPTPSATAAQAGATATPKAPGTGGPKAWLEAALLSPGQTLAVHFDRGMDPASADFPLLTDPYLAGSYAWSADSRTLSFLPRGGFRAGMTYQVYLDPHLAAADGSPFEPLPHWALQIRNMPRLSNITPPSGLLQERQPVIRLLFDRSMDADSVARGLAVEPAVPLDLKWQGQTLTVRPREVLAPGVHYQFSLLGSAQDATGTPLGEEARWDYWLDSFRASVSAVRPDGFDLLFSYPLQTAPGGPGCTIEPPLSGKWEWADNRTARFRAADTLAVIPSYQLGCETRFKDLSGQEFPPLEALSFQPLNAISDSWPRPKDDATDTLSYIWINFNRPVDHAAVEAAFSLSPALKGTFSWMDEAMRFTPDEDFPRGVEITPRLDVSARDARGQAILTEPYTWTFHLPAASKEGAHFNEGGAVFGQYGPNFQVLDLNGRRAVQLVNPFQKDADLTLYRLDKSDLAADYRAYFMVGGYYNQNKLLETRGLEKLAVWPVAKTDAIQEMLMPRGLEAGAYLLELRTEGQVSAQLFVDLTSYRLALKRSGERLWVWATDFQGRDAAALHVRLYTASGAILREGDTEADGTFNTSLPQGDAPLLVTAMDKGGDMSIAGLNDNWRSDKTYWGYPGYGRNFPSPARYYRSYLYTERPIYRPGQTIYFKAVVRGDDDTHFTLPKEGTRASLRLLDSRGNETARQELALNAGGSLNGSFVLSEGAMLGEYTLEASLEGEVFKQSFQVQEYRKPEFQVEASLGANAYVAGDRVRIEIDTRYFFGQPVANARIDPSLYLIHPKTQANWWEDVTYRPEALQAGDYTWDRKLLDQTSVNTDASGHASLEIPVELPSDNYYNCRSSWSSPLRECTLGIELNAWDADGQVVSVSKAIRVYNLGINYSLERGGWLKRPGEAFQAIASAVDLQGQPVAGRNLRLVVTGYTAKTYERRTVTSVEGKTGADGKLALPLKIDKEGSYELTLTDIVNGDFEERSTHQWVYVSGPARRWSQESYGSFEVRAERSAYRPYEKAKLMITSPFSGPALLTFERRQVIHSKAIQLTAPLTEVEVELVPEDAPNIFVTVNAWQNENLTLANVLENQKGQDFQWTYSLRDARLYQAKVELRVDPEARRLAVSITPDQASYQPRQEASLSVRVTDAQGQAVRAEFSLALVDEAIYSLSDERAGSIFNAFYGRRELNIETYDSLALTRILYYRSAFGGGGGDLPMPYVPRSNFQDTAVWLPEVHTDASGLAVVKVKLPDNLTSWRVVVKATSDSMLMGEATTNLLTQQELVLRPLLPQELTAGDRFALSAVAHNYAKEAREVTVRLEAPGLEIAGANTQSVRLAAGESQAVVWQVQAGRSGDWPVTLRGAALRAGEEAALDAVQLTLKVRPRAVSLIDGQAGDFQGSRTLELALPPYLLPGSASTLQLSRSIGGSMLEGLEYLTGYPYGCVEQTMSRALPNAVVGRALAKLGIQRPELGKKLPELINAGLQRLYGYQHDDGGWGWWYDDQTDVYQSAWVVFGLAVTREAGYPVEAQVIERGVKYLQERLKGDEIGDPRIRAYVLYSLARAGQGEREQTLALAAKAASLDAFSQAGLALALQTLGEKQAAQAVLALLDARATRQGELAYWVGDHTDGEYHQKTMSSPVRTTALALSAYLQIAPGHERIAQMVRYLMAQRRPEGWGSTNETAYTLLALSDYLLQTQKGEGDLDYQVYLGEARLGSGTLKPGDPPAALNIPIERLKAGSYALRIVASGNLYYNLSNHYLQEFPYSEPAGTLALQREYLDPKTGLAVTRFQAGQVVVVRLSVKAPAAALAYVMVSDHLPGGLEAINESLNTSSRDGNQAQFDNQRYEWYWDNFQWQSLGYNYKEIRGGQVNFFLTTLPAGKVKVITYQARAMQSGLFTALPAEISAMYDATAWGRSGSAQVEVLPAPSTRP